MATSERLIPSALFRSETYWPYFFLTFVTWLCRPTFPLTGLGVVLKPLSVFFLVAADAPDELFVVPVTTLDRVAELVVVDPGNVA
jgi:hypothetical protein